jgi:hypothetical protein
VVTLARLGSDGISTQCDRIGPDYFPVAQSLQSAFLLENHHTIGMNRSRLRLRRCDPTEELDSQARESKCARLEIMAVEFREVLRC